MNFAGLTQRQKGTSHMSDNSTETIVASFETRAAADLAVEHLVQQLQIDRSDVFVQTSGSDNSSGVQPNGGDAETVDEEERTDGQLGAEIEVSADVAIDQAEAALQAMKDLGATRATRS
jgi:hypothetical protein